MLMYSNFTIIVHNLFTKCHYMITIACAIRNIINPHFLVTLWEGKTMIIRDLREIGQCREFQRSISTLIVWFIHVYARERGCKCMWTAHKTRLSGTTSLFSLTLRPPLTDKSLSATNSLNKTCVNSAPHDYSFSVL